MGNSNSYWDELGGESGGIGDEESGWFFQVLVYCDMTTRSKCVLLSKRYSKILQSQEAFKWQLERLHIENGIYFPMQQLPTNETWRSIYIDLYKRRHLWNTPMEGNSGSVWNTKDDDKDLPLWQLRPSSITGENFNITVCARFKPSTFSRKDVDSDDDKATLPLHQRLSLIRLSNKLETNQQALGVLKAQGGWFKDRWASIERKRSISSSKKEEEKEKNTLSLHEMGEKQTLSCGINRIDPISGRVVIVDPLKGLREFDFDKVFGDSSTQNFVYESSACRLVCDFINGFNSTCIVYGMTGSGKTYTMFGPAEKEMHISFEREKMMGIVPRACLEVLHATEFRRRNLKLKIDATISVSYVEIYGNEISDLLRKGCPCGHNKVSAQRYVLDGAAEILVDNAEHIMELLKIGEAQKRKAATAMNERSTRAHSIFVLTLNQKCHDTGVSHSSKLFLADLGGCEQTKKSQITSGRSDHIERLKQESMELAQSNDVMHDTNDMEKENDVEGKEYSTGFVQSDRMREAVYINLGLMALKSCVETLNSGNPSAYVPYANSKLTMMLSSGLGGNSKTAVIVCAAQEKDHIAETVAAMRFGQSCRSISNEVRTNENMLEDILRRIDTDIADCEKRIKENERWEVHEERRKDILAKKGTLEGSGFGGIEVRKTTVLVGAEDDRKHLAQLLQKRAKLTGTKLKGQIQGGRYGGNIGFGNAHIYGMGSKHQVGIDGTENFRFVEKVEEEDIPNVVREKIGSVGWKTGDDINEDSEHLAKRARTAKRNKLVYSGLSA
mmetsp:Transcript_7449/g.11085  ORF Transcript_7449/g.11085 Transcript_7449/m.11085 type:complete len:783 (+) Transcript_7449:104-2452(+)